MTIRAHFDGKRIVLDEPLPADLPPNTPVSVVIGEQSATPSSQPHLGDRLADLASDLELPADFASQHDHYVKGLPRR